MEKKRTAVLFAILAATLYAVHVPLSKILMQGISPAMLAGFLYLGAGTGMGGMMLVRKLCGKGGSAPSLGKRDLPYTVAMVVLDIAAPILLLFGVANTTAANVSLLNNFEIVATAGIAVAVFREKISGRLWCAVFLVVAASMILGTEAGEVLVFNRGSLCVIGACLCWGLENNCTRRISDKDPEQIVWIKGIFSGMGGIAVAGLLGEKLSAATFLLWAMLLGFVAYGLSIRFYIMAQYWLGAAKTSAFYSLAPFLGVGFSFVILRERPEIRFYIGLAVMAVATAVMIWDTMASVEEKGAPEPAGQEGVAADGKGEPL